jgi:hypothetical protein
MRTRVDLVIQSEAVLDDVAVLERDLWQSMLHELFAVLT